MQYTASAQPADSRVHVEIKAYHDGNEVRLNPVVFNGNSISLYQRAVGGTGGATGVALPHDLTFQTVQDGMTGTLYTVHVVRTIQEE